MCVGGEIFVCYISTSGGEGIDSVVNGELYPL